MDESDIEAGVETVRFLSEEIGPRPSASEEEKAAGLYVKSRFEDLGLEGEIQEFRSSRSFGPDYLVGFGLAMLAGLLRRGPARYIAGALAAALSISASRFSRFGLGVLTRRAVSRNLTVTIEPKAEVRRTICLVSHLDSSRSGLMFHPNVTPVLGKIVSALGLALLLQAADPIIGRFKLGRLVVWKARLMSWVAFGLVTERELRGENVAGANDNASGVGACVSLASRFVGAPLEHSRIVVLCTGSEESGVIGMSEFLATHETSDWCFVNFDGVSADASLRVLSKEGGPLGGVDADPELLRLAAFVGEKQPQLQATPLEHGSGLPYDSTPVLIKGGRAMTIVNQDGAIPDYHWPTDRFDHFSHLAFERAVSFAEQLVLEIDSA